MGSEQQQKHTHKNHQKQYKKSETKKTETILKDRVCKLDWAVHRQLSLAQAAPAGGGEPGFQLGGVTGATHSP